MKKILSLVKSTRGKVFFPLIFLFNFACSNEKEINIKQNYSLELVESIEIKLNDNGLSISDFQIRHIDNDIEIIRQNYGYRSLSIYSIKDRKEKQEIKLNMDNLSPYFEKGGGLTGFKMQGNDSLFVMNYNSGLILIDPKTGNYLSKFSLETANGNNNITISTRFPIYINNKKLLYTESANNFNENLFHEIEFDSNKVKNFGEFSSFYKTNSDYLGGSWYDYLSHIMINDSTLIYGHPISHNLKSLNLNKKEIFEIKNQIDFPVTSHRSETPINSLSEVELDELISNAYNNYHYVNLMYNANDKIFYRLLKKPISPEIFNSYPKPLKFWKNKTELVIYDENLKIIGKTDELPGEYQIGIFNDSEIFNLGHNIYIKRIPENDEFITYDIYEIIKEN